MSASATKKRSQGATSAPPNPMARWRAWLQHHRIVARESLLGLRRTPFASIVTCLVIGVALALPSAFYVAINNVQSAFGASDTGARLSLFLYDTVSESEGRELARELESWKQAERVDYISRQQALEEFTALSGFGEVVQSLPSNPLPAVLVLTLDDQSVNASAADGVRQRAEALPQVEQAQLDMAWLQRLQSMMALAARLGWVVGALLCVGVLLVIGNT
ncbi:cell division protein, partial [bacterium]|nr:cell division protein [bacterium]